MSSAMHLSSDFNYPSSAVNYSATMPPSSSIPSTSMPPFLGHQSSPLKPQDVSTASVSQPPFQPTPQQPFQASFQKQPSFQHRPSFQQHHRQVSVPHLSSLPLVHSGVATRTTSRPVSPMSSTHRKVSTSVRPHYSSVVRQTSVPQTARTYQSTTTYQPSPYHPPSTYQPTPIYKPSTPSGSGDVYQQYHPSSTPRQAVQHVNSIHSSTYVTSGVARQVSEPQIVSSTQRVEYLPARYTPRTYTSVTTPTNSYTTTASFTPRTSFPVSYTSRTSQMTSTTPVVLSSTGMKVNSIMAPVPPRYIKHTHSNQASHSLSTYENLGSVSSSVYNGDPSWSQGFGSSMLGSSMAQEPGPLGPHLRSDTFRILNKPDPLTS